MTTEQEAKDAILDNIETQKHDYIVIDENPLEEEFGWVFFYTSRKYYETGELKYAIAGNAPLIYEVSSNEIICTGTAEPIEKYLEAYRKVGDPHAELTTFIEINEGKVGASAVNAIKLIRDDFALNLKETKTIIDSVLSGRKQKLECDNDNQTYRIVNELGAMGFVSKLSWHPSSNKKINVTPKNSEVSL